MTNEEAISIIERDNPNNISSRTINEEIFDKREKAFNMAVQALRQQKTGCWCRRDYELTYTCSECNTTNASGVKYNYCPHCGAKMEV